MSKYFKQFTSKNKKFKLKNYSLSQEVKHKARHELAPKTPCRILIIGSSGSGKTNLLLNMIYNLLPWTKLYIYAKNLFEPKYKQLKDTCCIAEKKQKENFAVFENDENNIIDIDELNPEEHNLIVFDDFLTTIKAQSKIYDLFIRGRKHNATVVYLTQSYFDTPKCIRLQCNYLFLFKPNDERDVSEFYRNHSCGLNKEDFKKIINEATSSPKYSFLCIDQNTDDPKLRLTKNFTHILS